VVANRLNGATTRWRTSIALTKKQVSGAVGVHTWFSPNAGRAIAARDKLADTSPSTNEGQRRHLRSQDTGLLPRGCGAPKRKLINRGRSGDKAEACRRSQDIGESWPSQVLRRPRSGRLLSSESDHAPRGERRDPLVTNGVVRIRARGRLADRNAKPLYCRAPETKRSSGYPGVRRDLISCGAIAVCRALPVAAGGVTAVRRTNRKQDFLSGYAGHLDGVPDFPASRGTGRSAG
jgi:hypothetical protein